MLDYSKKLSQGCFIKYNNACLYEYIKLSEKVQMLVIKMSSKSLLYYYECIKLSPKKHKPFSSYAIISKPKMLNYKKKQIRVMGLVPIMLDNHREQVCGVSINSLQ
jgi:hypothetical protein